MSTKENEYIELTKKHLRGYNRYKVRIKNLKIMITVKEANLANSCDISAPIAKYGGMPGGGHRELNAVEAMADRRITLAREIKTLQAELDMTQSIIDMVDNTIGALDETDKEIVREYIIDGRTAEAVAHTHFFSERWVRQRAGNAVAELAMMMFGHKAYQARLNFDVKD